MRHFGVGWWTVSMVARGAASVLIGFMYLMG